MGNPIKQELRKRATTIDIHGIIIKPYHYGKHTKRKEKRRLYMERKRSIEVQNKNEFGGFL